MTRPRSHTQASPQRRFSLAALKLAAREPWENLTLAQIAKEAKLSAAEAQNLYPDKTALLADLVASIDELSVKTVDPKAPAHDRLFDALMARFDVLQTHRAGIVAIAQSSRRHPHQALAVLRAQGVVLRNILERCGLAEQGPRRLLQQTGLQALYNFAFLRWINDTTPDMAKTMACLDQALRQGGKLAGRMFRN